MKYNNTLLKSILSCLLIGGLFSVTFAATSQRGRDILDQLRDDGRTDDEIRQAMKDLGYNPVEYLGVQTNPKLTVVNGNSTSNNTTNSTSNGTSKLGRDILNQFRKDGRTDEEIKEAIEDLGYDSSAYFPSSNTTTSSSNIINGNYSSSTYVSRSCKPYTVEYIQSLNAYTSPDLRKREYFVNIDYLKRYVDSKNAQNAECYIGGGWISSSYADTNTRSDRYIAPNGKIYFITQLNGAYTSNELSVAKSFSTIDELKNYIRKRNPLINMGVTNYSLGNSQQNVQANIVPAENSLRNIAQEIQGHGSAEEQSNTTQTNEQANNQQTNNTNQQTNNENQSESEKDANIISDLWNQLFS